MRITSKILLAAGVMALPLAIRAEDWPQWRGPNRDATSKETGLLKTWPKDGPELLWTFDKAGSGYASFAVVGGKVYTMGTRENDEIVLALDDKGKELWSARIGSVFDFKGNNWSRGPNATPTVDGDLIFALGSQGDLLCVDTGGKERWRKELTKELGAQVNDIGGGPKNLGWGFSWSPLVDGEQLVCVPGGPQGLFAALNKKTGEVLWRSKDVKDRVTYSSPIVATIGGVKQYIQMTQEGAVAVDAKSGDLLWYFKRENPWSDILCPTPICQGDRVYVTGGAGGCNLIKVEREGDKFKATEVYGEKQIANWHGGVVLVGKYVYGYHAEREWACQDFAEGGDNKWDPPRRGLGPGSLLYADGRLYCVSEKDGKGVVAMLEASPEAYKEISRFTLPRASAIRKNRGGVWTHPVLSDGRLYVRDQELIFCYKVK
jgi:outer membrane protein assembly factor BamB